MSKWSKGAGTRPCPHASYPVIFCARCVQFACPPERLPIQPSRETPKEAREKRPEAWKAILPGGEERVFPVTRGLAAITLRRQLRVRRLPRGTRWEPA